MSATKLPSPHQVVRRFPCNTLGRDFVVGDIHGAFSLLRRAMETVRFDPDRDRLFSVGDLIDRGPESEAMVEFLAQPGVFAVAGNHELMLLNVVALHGIDTDRIFDIFHRNGMSWWLQTPVERRTHIVEAILQLPMAIEIQTARGSVGLVHAGVPQGMDWPRFCEALERYDPELIEHATTSRDRLRAVDRGGVPGVGRVFVGHSVVNGVQQLGNVYYVDTGAVFGAYKGRDGAGLTLANIAAATVDLSSSAPAPTLLNIIDLDVPGNAFSSLQALG